MTRELLQLVSEKTELASLDPAARRLAMRTLLRDSSGADPSPRSVAELSDWIDGFGPLTSLMNDPLVTDVLVNGVDEVWVERRGELEPTDVRFTDLTELVDLVDRLCGSANVRVDASHPIADGRLQDGSRVHVVLPPVSGRGPTLSIRRFPQKPFGLDELVGRGLLAGCEAEQLRTAVLERRNIVISGATGVGKTTLANALLGCVPPSERVVLIEETAELRPGCAHWISLLTRQANVEGSGEIDQLSLMRAALRMRPDRIVVGEVRGAEAYAALQAMSTGHEGSLCTIHARCAGDAFDRFVELARLFPSAASEDALRRKAERACDVVVHVGKEAGRRRVLEILDRGS